MSAQVWLGGEVLVVGSEHFCPFAVVQLRQQRSRLSTHPVALGQSCPSTQLYFLYVQPPYRLANSLSNSRSAARTMPGTPESRSTRLTIPRRDLTSNILSSLAQCHSSNSCHGRSVSLPRQNRLSLSDSQSYRPPPFLSGVCRNLNVAEDDEPTGCCGVFCSHSFICRSAVEEQDVDMRTCQIRGTGWAGRSSAQCLHSSEASTSASVRRVVKRSANRAQGIHSTVPSSRRTTKPSSRKDEGWRFSE